MKQTAALLILITLLLTGCDEKAKPHSDCISGSTKCEENLVQKCNNGKWENWTDCEAENKICRLKEGNAECFDNSESNDEVADELNDEVADELNDEATDESNDEATDESNDEATDESNDEATDESNDEATDESNDEATDESNDETTDESNDETTDESNDEVADESNDEVADESNDETTDESNDEVADDDAGSFPCSTSGEIRFMSCGYNGKGTQKQKCLEGFWENDGECTGDPDECTISTEQNLPCGKNNRGTQLQVCPDGAWINSGECDDPDICIDGETSTESGTVNYCKTGQWVLMRTSHQWGSADSDGGRAIATDSYGNIYVTGYINLSTETGNENPSDAFLTKLSSDGTEIWTKQWGTNLQDEGTAVSVDSLGNIFVTGFTEGNLSVNNFGLKDLFLVKFSGNGTKLWTKQWGTTEDESPSALIIDSSDNIYISGSVDSDGDGSADSHQWDSFLTKLDNNGNILWSDKWGTDKNDNLNRSILFDSSGNIIVSGTTYGTFEGNTNAGGSDIFHTKFNSSGTRLWIRQWGTENSDTCGSSAIDNSNNIYVTVRRHLDFELIKFNSEATVIWTETIFEGAHNTGLYQIGTSSITVSSENKIFIAGYSTLTLMPEAFLIKTDSEKTELWTQKWSGWTYPSSLLYSSGKVYVAGYGSHVDAAECQGTDAFLSIWYTSVLTP